MLLDFPKSQYFLPQIEFIRGSKGKEIKILVVLYLALE